MTTATLIATLRTLPSPGGEELAALPAAVEWLEVRADLLRDIDPDWLRQHFRGRLLYALRSRAEGGHSEDSREERHERLRRAARSYDAVELEGERDFAPELLDEIAADRRLVSWHGAASDLADLAARFARISAVPARLYKLVVHAAKCSDELLPLSLLNSLGRTDTVAYADGPLGFWTRLVAPRLGAPVVFGLVPEAHAPASEPSINKLVEDYGLPQLSPVEGIYGIVGSPVFHSLSPRLHNAAYREMNHPALYVPLHVETFEEFWGEVVNGGVLETLKMPFKGLTVASPHKEAALLAARKVAPMAQRAESANILVRDNGSWRADTTDPEVALMARRGSGVRLRQQRAAVIGCGGAGRAIATALAEADAEVTLVNRGAARGHYAAQLLDLPYVPLPRFSAEGFDIVVNATPVGRDDNDAPFEVGTLSEDAVVIDLVYGSQPTPLVAGAVARGRTAMDGREVLLAQVLRQFQLMIGREMPAPLVRGKLGFAPEPSDLQEVALS